jgi:selenocysteine lyase/cysteine desulfurase
MNFKQYFSRALMAAPGRLHFAAHSHHLWPDASFDAHCQAWHDAAALADRKWDHILGQLMPRARREIAGLLQLPDPDTVVFAGNTHELVNRLFSCLRPPVRILTSDGEFHSFHRQSRRWEEAGLARVERIPTEPLDSFAGRLLTAAARHDHDLIYLSQVMFDSGMVFDRLEELTRAAAPDTYLVIDGYHGFLAIPTDLSAVASRLFYLAGGYKYAMSGEGVCFMHCPPGWGLRPVDTGWFAAFTALGQRADTVAYAPGGARFAGATFDPSGLYRFAAVTSWLRQLGLTVADIHAHVQGLQRAFLTGLAQRPSPLRLEQLLPAADATERGHFLTFRCPEAAALERALDATGVVVDHRGDRLRVGFGLYHDAADVSALLDRLAAIRV